MVSIKGAKKIIKSAGLVFGDIGTSPLYTFTVIFLFTKATEANIMGVLSLIFWTLTTLVTIEYAWLATSLEKKGEGGTIVLREILVPFLKSKKHIALVTILTYIGISLLIGDGVITPAISILSAVEGILLIPGLENTSNQILIFVAGTIAIILFSFQRKGSEKVAGAFGPLMVLWFSALAITGIVQILHNPSVFNAINPYYAINFLFSQGLLSLIVLSNVILCATGGEALYADMGHMGKKPIVKAWYIVFFAIVLNYFGQGAYLINHPGAKNILFEMIYSESTTLYIPFLVLSIVATVIASQAMISGMFSIAYLGITTRIMPLLKVDYTSIERRSQIYIGFVNWFLLFFVLAIMLAFRESKNLASAYGLAVTGTMTFTAIMMTWIFYLQKKYTYTLISSFVLLIDLIFLIANTTKIPSGGYWSIIIALIPFTIILIYTSGQTRLYQSLKPVNLQDFVKDYTPIYEQCYRIKGSALFFSREISKIPPYIVNTLFCNNIIYEDNIIVSVTTTDEPHGITYAVKKLSAGLHSFEIKGGYMDVIDVENIFEKAGINGKVIFYGIEDISTDNIIWKVFSIMKKLTPSFVQFYSLPPSKLHGIIMRIYM